jgi:enterochelin esterase-like enzyme
MRLISKSVGLVAVLACLATGGAHSQPAAPQTPVDFEVKLPPGAAGPVSGRLIVMVAPAGPFLGGRPATPQALLGMLTIRNTLGLSPATDPANGAVTVARKDVRLTPGASVKLNERDLRSPETGSTPEGDYLIQAVLDTNADFAYANRANAGDLVSDVVVWHAPGPHPILQLTRTTAPLPSRFDQPPGTQALTGPAAETEANRVAARAHAERVEMATRAMTAFSPKAPPLQAWVLTPPGYETSTERYPVVFWNGGFGVNFSNSASAAEQIYGEMARGQSPPMIWVILNHGGPWGTHEFADSANNGPWGRALTEEFIPWLDGKYRTDGAKGRFITGHSSGGWASLWLQVRYPKVFAGTWPTAPDPSDFHDFTNVDIYAAGANAYRRADGSLTPLVRGSAGRAAEPLRDYAAQEMVLGDTGGQFASFDWVFSPRGPDGRPQPLFDRKTGAIDPKVALYWRDNYDIAWRIKRDWATLKPDLDGKIHLWVGTADTFHLDGSAHLLKAALDSVGARSEFHFVEGASHSTLTALDTLKTANPQMRVLERRIAWEIYAQARPNSPLKPPA